MTWLAWVVSPIGRWLSAVAGVIVFITGVYWKGRAKGKEIIRQEQDAERNRRSKDAIEADHRVRRDLAAGRLLENDGHRRD